MSSKHDEKPKPDAKTDAKATTGKPGMIDTPKTGMTKDSEKADYGKDAKKDAGKKETKLDASDPESPNHPGNQPNLPASSYSNDPVNVGHLSQDDKSKNKAGQPVKKEDSKPKGSWE